MPKFDERVEAYGTVDELMAFTALLGDMMRSDEALVQYVESIDRINCVLMSVASLLAVGKGAEGKVSPISESKVSDLEAEIDAMQAKVQPITKFTIPGGCSVVSQCHICRTVCRRAERRAIEAAENYEIESAVLVLLNRLSDYLYALCRTITERLEAEEVLWRP